MSLRTTFLVLLLVTGAALAQVPPGDPYDPARHPNPIITYVTKSDFKDTTYEAAQKGAGFELLGLSQSEGKLDSIASAAGMTRKTRIGNQNMDVNYYSVVRQTFKLAGGAELILHSFKFPKTPMPPDISRMILNQAAVEKKKNPREMRFGGTEMPEESEIRGREALLFENEAGITLYWEENGIGHTAAAKIDRKELFRLVEDLL